MIGQNHYKGKKPNFRTIGVLSYQLSKLCAFDRRICHQTLLPKHECDDGVLNVYRAQGLPGSNIDKSHCSLIWLLVTV
jgi:hypothetical protein